LQVKIQNRKTGFTGSPKPVFGFEKTPRLTGFSVSVKTGLETLVMAAWLSLPPVYDSRHLQADCQELGSAPEP